MQDNRVQQATTAAEYRAAFRLSSPVLEVSAIPERYRWSDDRIRTDLIARDQRRVRADWLRSVVGRGWKRLKVATSQLKGNGRAEHQGATKTSVPG